MKLFTHFAIETLPDLDREAILTFPIDGIWSKIHYSHTRDIEKEFDVIFLGQGCARMTFQISENVVVKILRNPTNRYQMETEWKNWQKYCRSFVGTHLCPLFAMVDGYKMTFAQKAHMYPKNSVLRDRHSEWVRYLSDFFSSAYHSKKVDHLFEDIHGSNVGSIGKTPVLIDYGF